MKIVIPGHLYELDHLDGEAKEKLQFVDRDHGRDAEGTFNQEVLRVLIDRVKFLNSEKTWEGNAQILYHLRMALVLHETRALCRKVEKGKLQPESLPVGNDGHFLYSR
jgi:hypothetical protein